MKGLGRVAPCVSPWGPQTSIAPPPHTHPSSPPHRHHHTSPTHPHTPHHVPPPRLPPFPSDPHHGRSKVLRRWASWRKKAPAAPTAATPWNSNPTTWPSRQHSNGWAGAVGVGVLFLLCLWAAIDVNMRAMGAYACTDSRRLVITTRETHTQVNKHITLPPATLSPYYAVANMQIPI